VILGGCFLLEAALFVAGIALLGSPPIDICGGK
jgi:hypothetical protein